MASVSLMAAKSYDQQQLAVDLEKLLAPLGGMSHFVKRGDRVLLKPNLLTGAKPGREAITRPEIVYTVAKIIKDMGAHPFIGDSPAFGSAMGVAKANDYLPMLAELNVPIIDFRGKRYETVSQDFNHLRLSKEAMEADVVINLPKLKSHSQLTLTMGVKNLFGCVPGKMKAWWHMEAGKDANRFGEMLVETARAIDPDLTILDGIIGHEGNGPANGEPRFVGLLAASPNVFALDRAILEVLKVDLALVPTLVASQRLGLCPDLAEIEFPHLHPREMQISDWKLPEALIPIDFGLPRVLKSAFRHLYIRLIKEPMNAYAERSSAIR